MPYHYGAIRSDIKCAKCQIFITEIQNYVECDVCKQNFHLKCAGLYGLHITRTSNEKDWKCKSCRTSEIGTQKDESKRRAESSPENDSNKRRNTNKSPNNICTESQFDKLLRKLDYLENSQTEIKSIMNDVKSNQEFLSDQFDNLKSELQKVTIEQNKMKKNCNILQTEQNNHSKIIADLESQVDSLKQKELENKIIISNLPKSNFDKTELLTNIFDKIQSTCTVNDIKNVEIIPTKDAQTTESSTSKTNQNKSKCFMIVTFNNEEKKIEFMEKKKSKGSLMSNEVGLNSGTDQQIYIRDQLTQFKMKLFREARILKDSLNFKFLWMNGSNICLRKQEHSKVYIISSQIDIKNIETLFKSQSEVNTIENQNNTSDPNSL